MRGVPYFRSMFYRRPRDAVSDESSGVMINHPRNIDRNLRSSSNGQAIGKMSGKLSSRKGKVAKGEEELQEPTRRSISQNALDSETDHQNSDAASLALVAERSFSPEDEVNENSRNDSASLKHTRGTSMCRESSFTDLEMASGPVSDPGVNRMKDLESLLSSPPQMNGERSERAKSEVPPASLDGRSECESARHPDAYSTFSGRRGLLLSGENSSVGGEGKELASRAAIRGSPRSDGAIQYDPKKSMFKVGVSSRALGVHQKKPWWKTFLVSLRNIHREADRGNRSPFKGNVKTTPVGGYVSDVEARVLHRSLSVLNEAESDLEEGVGEAQSPHAFARRSGRLPARKSEADLEEQHDRYKSDGCDLTKSEAEGDYSKSDEGHDVAKSEGSPELEGDHVGTEGNPAFPIDQSDRGLPDTDASNVAEWIKTTRKMDAMTRRTGSNRVEEWLKTAESMPQDQDSLAFEDEEGAEGEESPGSPTAPAAAYFENGGVGMHGQGGTRRGDFPTDADLEAGETAKMIMRAVNPLSTVAHFSGMGLSSAPALGIYTNLKTLNLSANSIVRIPPRCLPKSLHSLDISRNSIVIVEGLRDLTRLRVLNMSFNRISRIGNGLSTCTSLRELYLAGNRISEVEGLRRLSKLVVLDLSFNKLTTLRSLSRVSVNNESLQALNVLGNAVHSNVGDEQLRRYLTYLCTDLLFLNKQPLKPVSSREALGRELKATYKNSSGKPTARHSHRKSHGTGVSSSGKLRSSDKRVSPALLSHEDGHHHRKSHGRTRSSSKPDLPSTKSELPKGFVAISPGAADDILKPELPHARAAPGLSSVTMSRVRSDGSLFREDHSSPIAESLRAVHARMR